MKAGVKLISGQRFARGLGRLMRVYEISPRTLATRADVSHRRAKRFIEGKGGDLGEAVALALVLDRTVDQVLSAGDR